MRNILMACVALACVSPAMAAEPNICAVPEIAKVEIAALNELFGIKGVVVDLEDITTTLSDVEHDKIACHFTVVFKDFSRRSGTLAETSKNAAGEGITRWVPDAGRKVGSRT
jgi:hypothetical protein